MRYTKLNIATNVSNDEKQIEGRVIEKIMDIQLVGLQIYSIVVETMMNLPIIICNFIPRLVEIVKEK